MYRSIRAICVVLAALLAVSCGGGGGRSLNSISVSPATSQLGVGATLQYTATATFSDGTTTDVTASSSWTSSATAIASINASSGSATAVAIGQATITAIKGSISGSATLTVIAPTVVSISVTPNSFTTGVGIARQMTATGTYTDGSTNDVTGTATWASSAPSVASVSRGLVSGVSMGTSNISATVGTISGSGVLTVTSNTWVSAAVSITGPRAQHTATLLTNGKVLVVAGQDGVETTGPEVLSTAEIYDPAADSWSPTANLYMGVTGPLATLMSNGEVLVVGGVDLQSIGGIATVAGNLYAAVTNTWIPVGDMNYAHYQGTLTLLLNGQALAAGGSNTATASPQVPAVELFDPTTNTWSYAASMANARINHTATLLSNGKVLVAGGADPSPGILSSAEIYDPVANTWSPAASMSTPRTNHTATLLADGTVLVAGGTDSLAGTPLASAEVYDPATDSWSTVGSMASARALHTANLLPDGTVLVTGGGDGAVPAADGSGNGALASAELYDPATQSWSPAGSMAAARAQHTATLLPNGSVLVTGGVDNLTYLSSSELYL
jgi:N-acetylneuraminic acid mutarotase